MMYQNRREDLSTELQVDQKPLMNVSEVADYLGVSKLTIWRWEKSGEIPKAIAIGGTIRWKRSDIQKWLDEKK
jgi:prophage regulatory protein